MKQKHKELKRENKNSGNKTDKKVFKHYFRLRT